MNTRPEQSMSSVNEDLNLPPVAAGQSEKLNILLVDDNPGKLLAHETVLEELGENVVTATSGQQALELMLRQEFAVILLDVNMPDLDGFETARLIRQRPRYERIPIIFITAYNTTDIDRLHGYKLGAVDYLFLPVVPDVLKAKVKVFVELARQTQVIRRQAEHLAFHNQEQARQLQLIQDLNNTLMETNKELESFSYSVSHDLRAPLRALKGFSEYLLESCADALDEEGKDCIRRIHRSAVCMDNLTHDLLRYTHIGRETVEMQGVDPADVVREVLSMNPGLQAGNLDLQIRPEMHQVLANKSLLLHCLNNLISNAVKFVPPGIRPRIRIYTDRPGADIRICVEDNGIGIDPAHQKRIFGLFERVGNVQRYEGTGVGLAIVARAAERMHGRCGVNSSPGAGSCFWIELPPAPDAAQACATSMSCPQTSAQIP